MRDYINEIFSDDGIEEIRRRLGLSNQVEGESDEDEDVNISFEDEDIVEGVDIAEFIDEVSPEFVPQGGIAFPQNITIPTELINYRVGPDGSTVADIIVKFDDVSGAADYAIQYVSPTQV